MNSPAANPPPLRILFWESTTRCNLDCTHCRRVDPDISKNELTTREVEKVFESTTSLGRPMIIFSGGEPLVRKEWEHMAMFAQKLEFPTALATNGTLIDRKIADQINAAGFRRVSVSIDGADSETHDRFRGVPGCFDLAQRGIDLLLGTGTRVQINVTVTRRNIDQVKAIYQNSVERGIEAMHLFMLVPVGCGASIGETDQLSPLQYEQMLSWIYHEQSKAPIELRATCAPHYNRIAGDPGPGCLAGISVIFLSHTGEVFPCGYLPVSCGSVRETTLPEIWRNSTLLAELRNRSLLKGKCGCCQFRQTCAGCRARAFAATGDYLQEEPACIYMAQETEIK